MVADKNIATPEPATTAADWKTTDVGSVFVSNYPPYSFWTDGSVNGVTDMLAESGAPDTPMGLYLHIPFCRKRCKFCYFRVYTDKNAREIDTYCDALAREIELYAETARTKGRSLDFVYFGGGTPSYISVKHLNALVDRVKQAMPWDQAREVAFECEPGTLTQPKLEAIKGIGVTRLSLGVENMIDEILRENGRAHVTDEIYRVMPRVHELGFDQVNVDLISGMVGETWETWQVTVQKTIDLDPDSLTIYQMELPFNTVYSKSIREEENSAPAVANWETKRAWHDYAIETFRSAGYEVASAYALVKKDRPTSFVYRDALWHSADMIGTGVASFSHVGGVHFQNKTHWDAYLGDIAEGRLPLNRAFTPTDEERFAREMILQLKLGHISASYFSEKFGVDILERYAPQFRRLDDEGMLSVEDGQVRLSRQGLLRVDQLLPAFYEPKYQCSRYT
ncbi:TPA: coproporphyrinogen III oxidase [Candidatus Latescibacteria bacterium]|nr:coproporphyrinogen III oxidase [Candidatus Latescibacterota bacterium]